MRFKIKPLVLVLAICLAHVPFLMSEPVQAQLADTPWPKFGRDMQNTGRSPYAGWTDNSLSWFYPVGGYINASPVIGADGTVYFGAADNKFYALRSGRLEWFYPTDGIILGSAAIGADGTIYFASGDGKLYALNSDGTLKWAYPYPASSPAIGSDNTIYFAAYGNFCALNPDGTLKWSLPLAVSGYGSPAIGPDNTIYIGGTDGKLYAINPDGTEKWSYQTGGIFFGYSLPAVGADGTIYIGSTDGKLYAVNPDGTEKWTYPTGDRIHSSPAIGLDGTIYIVSRDRKLYALNLDGTEKWTFTLDFHTYGSPSIDSTGTIYIGDHGGRVDGKVYAKFYAINPDGTLKWTYITWGTINTRPAIASDGTIYFGTWDPDHKLYAIGPSVGVISQLTITPATFTLQPGQSITLTAFLASNGNPLPGRLIMWDASFGTIDPSSGTTDSQGRVEVIYTAPDSKSEFWVARGKPPVDRVIASFAGDNQYLAGSGDLSLTIETAVKEEGIPWALTTVIVAAFAIIGVAVLRRRRRAR